MKIKLKERFERELGALVPKVEDIYRSIEVYNLNKIARTVSRVKEKLNDLALDLNKIRPWLPEPRQAYFIAMADRTLPIEDRIIALNISIDSLPLEFSVPNELINSKLSPRLCEALATCTLREDDFNIPPGQSPAPDNPSPESPSHWGLEGHRS